MEQENNFTIKEILGELRKETRTTHELLIMHMGREESQLENILIEGKKTNGRVTALEEHYHNLTVKHESIGVKMAAITGFIAIVVAAIVSYTMDSLFK